MNNTRAAILESKQQINKMGVQDKGGQDANLTMLLHKSPTSFIDSKRGRWLNNKPT